MSSEAEVLTRREGAAGVIILNRPKALNAITHQMVRDIQRALTEWESDPAITRVLVKSGGGRAFCAGGDIRAVHDMGRAGRTQEALVFWREEYILNRHIKRYSKPYVSLIDGIVMGGGVGVTLHGSHRVAGDRYSFAMPEVAIGFFPDVGATYALPRLPVHSGDYLAITGQRINRADALEIGLATHAVSSDALGAVEAALVAGEDVEAVLASHAAPKAEAPILAHRDVIDRVFALDSIPAILDALEAEAATSPFAAETAAGIRTKSPTSLCLSLAQMRRGAELSFEQCMTLEMRIVTRVVEGEDFYEGVRAVIIDKDQKPRWKPSEIAQISNEAIEKYFAPLANDLSF